MKTIFYLQGYGVPKNILTDENYNRYLNFCFNYIYDYVLRHKVAMPLIVFSGGATDLFKPYKRTEAGEMARLFKKLVSRPDVRKETVNWAYQGINSLSAVEGLLVSQKLVGSSDLVIFCEKTRETRMLYLAKKIFSASIKVEGVDFDSSSRRYLDLDVIDKKERKDLEKELKIIKNPKLLLGYRQEKLKRLKTLRQNPSKDISKFFLEEYRT